MAIQGRIYHRGRPSHQNSAIRWLLYDGFVETLPPYQSANWFASIPRAWITAFKNAQERWQNLLAHPRSTRGWTSNRPYYGYSVKDTRRNRKQNPELRYGTVTIRYRCKSIRLGCRGLLAFPFKLNTEYLPIELCRGTIAPRRINL